MDKSQKTFFSSLRAEGKTYAEIAILWGCSTQAVQNFCQRHGIEKPKKEETKSAFQQRKEAFGNDDLYALARLKYTRKRQNCKAKGEEFTISFEEIEWPEVCPVLGIPLSYETESFMREEGSVSFDKIDPTRGYVPGNVKIISWRANRIKNDGTADEHRMIAEYIDKHVN